MTNKIKVLLGSASAAVVSFGLTLIAHAQMTTSTIAGDLDDTANLFQQIFQVLLNHWVLFLIGLVVVVGGVIFAVRKLHQLITGGGGGRR